MSLIQNILFKIGSSLASQNMKYKLSNSDIEQLERYIDKIEIHLPTLTSFILPSGSMWSSYAHIARCVVGQRDGLHYLVLMTNRSKYHQIY